jgi:diguanylate cyclase (GGDEF)-like protein
MDWEKPIEIAEDIFWVGAKLPEDKFQCHVYLLRHGEESVLFDPGSLLTFEKTLRKIKSLIDPREVKYFVCHHQDPDITASISRYEDLYPRDDRLVVTHWRTQALLKHYAWKAGFYIVDEHDWKLKLGDDRLLKFIFTPYAHFPGAICTYDVKTKVLFSSDIFGGFISQDTIFAEDTSCFEDVKLFHEHYMPSSEILRHALSQIRSLDLNLIAPQHGYIIPRELIPVFIDLLSNLECGLFKFSYETRNVVFLSHIGHFFQRVITALIKHFSFEDTLGEMHRALYELFEIEDFSVVGFGEPEVILYRPLSGIKHQILDEDSAQRLRKLLKSIMEEPFQLLSGEEIKAALKTARLPYHILLPLALPQKELGIAFLSFKEKPERFLQSGKDFLQKLAHIITHLLNKELEIASAEKEKERFYNYAVRDNLTGVYNRFYLNFQFKEFMANVLRYHIPLSVITLDIDHFKGINDTYGHLAGDRVLKRLAEILIGNLRRGDIVIRYGGEEFLILLPYTYLEEACEVAERIRKTVAESDFPINGTSLKVTISLGVAFLEPGIRSLEDLIRIADERLYMAKNSGRNRVICGREQ